MTDRLSPAEKNLLNYIKSFGSDVVFRDQIVDHMSRGRDTKGWVRMMQVYIHRLRKAGYSIETVHGYRLTPRR